MENEVFLDTAYAIALSSKNDRLHPKALVLAKELQNHQTRIITTRAIMMEIGNALSKQRFRSISMRLLQSLDHDRSVEIIPIPKSYIETRLICIANDLIKNGD